MPYRSETFKQYEASKGVYDFYRCHKCGALFTREQEVSRLKRHSEQGGGMCSCRSLKYTPAWPSWHEWLRPTVIRYVIKVILARVIAPKVRGRASWLMPPLEWAVRYSK